MPLYAILHTDIEGLHAHSCTLVTAASRIEIVQQMIADPSRWQPLLIQLYPDDNDPRNVWQRMQTDSLSPEIILAWIDASYCTDAAEMLRIQPVELRSLAHVRVQTRWCNAHTSEGCFDISSEPIHPSPADVPETVATVLAAYIDLRQRRGRALSAQLVQLRQQVGVKFESMRQQEVEFTARQTQLLDRLCPHFAIDAKPLLTTPDFQQFVRSMLTCAEVGVLTPPLQVLQNPTDWILHTLPHPIQLHRVEPLSRSDPPEPRTSVVHLQATLADWSQRIAVPIGELQDGLIPTDQADYRMRQWIEVAVQLQPNLTQLPIASYRQVGLAQELVCLLAYIGELFNTTGMVDRLNQLPV
ncbi:hypothetical protein ACQ4M3_41955 [Leptolyngbya sp. AN03gr2]|uniref:hypothetical protein n=1 Tax=unclassified Leptolyngbya TaxID=2650499 RepID=UPI003D320A56